MSWIHSFPFFKIMQCMFRIKRGEERTTQPRSHLHHTPANYMTSCDRPAKLALHQRSQQANTVATTADTNPAWFLNTLALCSIQMHQTIRTTRESKAFLLGLSNLFLNWSHQAVKQSAAVGERWCHPLCRRHLNQSS
jgi:hypothetical protein